MKPTLDLASRSPRRRHLLEAAGFEVFCVESRAEPTLGGGDPRQAAIASAQAKLPRRSAEERVLLAADTVVALPPVLFGKPKDRADARAMLWALSGRRHEVVTGVALRYLDHELVFAVTSHVVFRSLIPSTVAHYLDSEEYTDKAGGYGLQGLGVALVDRVEGSYSNVVGLPVTELLSRLQGIGVQP